MHGTNILDGIKMRPSASKFFDDCKNSSQGIPVGVSEYGGGASINHHQWPLSMEDRADSHFHPKKHRHSAMKVTGSHL